MTKIQEEFHSGRNKLTKCLKKLESVCQSETAKIKKISIQPQNSLSNKKYKKSQSASKQPIQSSLLNVIGEEQQYMIATEPRKRSGTAGVNRPRAGNFTIEFQNGRPSTGQRTSNDRYPNKQTNQYKTLMTFESQERPRKSFYDDLQKQIKNQLFIDKIVSIPHRKKIQSRRSFKINKLF